MSLTWRDDLEVDWEELSALYRAAPLGDKPAAGLRIAFGNSQLRVFVRDGDRLVGAGRALADGHDAAYLCDIAVLPSHQGRGLGGAIVRHLLEATRGHQKIILYAVRGKEPLYAKHGFKPMTTAMAIFVDEAGALSRGVIRGE